jgi:CRP/FNR family transcriptional regulator, cyclic AMP receptor protein
MTENVLPEQLRQFQFLQDIEDEHLRHLAAIARLVEFPANKVLYREGQVVSNVYLILSGSVSIEICAAGIGCRRIMTVSAGDLLGISPAVGQSRSTGTVRTLAATRAIELNASQVLTLCEHNPRFGYEFMRQVAVAISQRLGATRLQPLDVFGAEHETGSTGANDSQEAGLFGRSRASEDETGSAGENDSRGTA